MTDTIKTGDKVRSFDFADGDWGRWLIGEHERAAYVEGEVVEIFEHIHGYQSYRIKVTKDVFGNVDQTDKGYRTEVVVPVNGTPKGFGDEVCDGVEKI